MEAAELLSEGKTKEIFAVKDKPTLVIVKSKDDITAGDGEKHDLIPLKGQWATTTTCNVFRLLQECGVPVAFKEQIDLNRFLAPKCKMIPLEVVVRREAHGSFLQRHPSAQKGNYFPRLIVEFHLKTKNRKWQGREQLYDLVADDPLVNLPAENEFSRLQLHDSHKPYCASEPFLRIPFDDVFDFKNVCQVFSRMSETAAMAFLVLEKAWQILNRKLVDFKIEFGIPADTALDENGGCLPPKLLCIADVIDNDSWRVLEGGDYIDKQVYRDGGDLSAVAQKYRLVADLTGLFSAPNQTLIFWIGSPKDDVSVFYEAISEILGDPWPLATGVKHFVPILEIICSGHKQPVGAIQHLRRCLADCADSVIVTYVGRSNGLGHMLAANCSVPVISVPANYKEFPEDVWSSLRMPSDVPLMTVLEPRNAVLAALQILAMRNPMIYSALRLRQEARLDPAA